MMPDEGSEARAGFRIVYYPTGQVLEAGRDFSVQIDVNDWTGPRPVFIKDCVVM